MIGKSTWDYHPYRPFLFEVGDIYISRVVPGDRRILFEWLADGEEFNIYYKKFSESDFTFAFSTNEKQYMLTELENDADYEFFVECGGKKSRVRKARTGRYVGTVVNYLHPEDDAYSFSGKYLCSPSLVRLDGKTLLASCDLYELCAPQNLTLIFESKDNGASWHYLSELMPCFWGKMFMHRGELYMLSCSTEYGDVLIGKSSDGGRTWGTPTVLLRGSGNRFVLGNHKNPQGIVHFNGRIYETLEWGSWGYAERHNGQDDCFFHAAMVMSCDEDDDLLCPENWHFTPPLKYNPEWEGVAKGKTRENLEGTLCVFPDGRLRNVMRYETSIESEPKFGKAICYDVDTENPDAPLKFSGLIDFPGNKTKFQIKFDEVSKKYYSICNYIGDESRINKRDFLVLVSSKDAENWEVVLNLLDGRGKPCGFQYADFMFDGDDLIFLCRTSMNGGNNFHDSNCITFHRIKNFRNI